MIRSPTVTGGTGNGGTVFDLTPGQGGSWTFNLIYSLIGPQLYGPEASLTMDAAGNLYGTTSTGGAYGYGAAFKLYTLEWRLDLHLATRLHQRQ